MKWNDKIRKRKFMEVIGLMVLVSAVLSVPAALSGKYRSEFSRTVDIVVSQDLIDGTVINDSMVMASISDACITDDSIPIDSTPTYSALKENIPENDNYESIVSDNDILTGRTVADDSADNTVIADSGDISDSSDTVSDPELSSTDTSSCTPSDIINLNN